MKYNKYFLEPQQMTKVHKASGILKAIFFTSLSCALLFSSASSMAAKVVNVKQNIAFPVFNSCTGEIVDIEARTHLMINEVEKDGVVHGHFRFHAEGWGYGQDTGANYRWNDTIHQDGLFGPAEQFLIMRKQHLRLIGQGRTENGRLVADIVFGLDESGEPIFEGFTNVICQYD